MAMDRISAELRGLGPLQALVLDPLVSDIYVNSPGAVWLDRGGGPEPAGVFFDSEQQLRALAVRLIAAGGRRLDDSSPCVDVQLPPGYRVHAVLPPIAAQGTLLSIRIKRPKAFTLSEMQAQGCLHPAMATVLRRLIDSRLSFLISGATGAGKTTLLSTLLGLCQEKERLVLIEDAAELDPDHGHVVTLEARHANAENAGAIDMAELVRQALRMNPNRLVVGECRGAEVRELLAALNTGHSGAGTLHANGAHDVPARLASLGALAGMSAEATWLQAASALDVLIHVQRVAGQRIVTQMGVIALRQGRLEATVALQIVPGPTAEMSLCVEDGWPVLATLLGLDPHSTPASSGGSWEEREARP